MDKRVSVGRDGGEVVLSVEGLSTYYYGPAGVVRAVEGVSFSVKRGQGFALVGESGCGKTTTVLSVVRLVPRPGKIVGGKVVFEGKDILQCDERVMRQIRGRRVGVVFQDGLASLNPVVRVGDQVAEVLRVHRGLGRRQGWEEAVRLLERVEIADAERAARAYPHELSGGMRQRVMLAIAIACRPALVICDEPTGGLDVTVSRRVLDLLRRIQRADGVGVVMVTHELDVAAGWADEVGVMYGGRIVERGGARQVFGEPLHPYTRALVEAMPRVGVRRSRLKTIGKAEGQREDGDGEGCRFRRWCERGRGRRICADHEPVLREVGQGRAVACWAVE